MEGPDKKAGDPGINNNKIKLKDTPTEIIDKILPTVFLAKRILT